MGTVLKGGILVELEPASVETADLRIEGSEIVARGADLPAEPNDEVISLGGKLVMSGLVCAHHHLAQSLSRGMPRPKALAGFIETLEATEWRYESALDLDTIHVAAAVGALDALAAGTTTLVDHHSSPKAVTGSLVRVGRGLNDVGLRGILSYAVSDRHGAVVREEALEESVTFIRRSQGRFRGMVGAHASYTLSNDALAGVKHAVDSSKAGVHLTLAEDPVDDRISKEKFGDGAVNRLLGAGLIDANSVLAHVVHLAWEELSQVITTGAWIAHNPRSNMKAQVGYAPALKFGHRATLGTDTLTPDMFAEAQTAYFRSLDAGQPIDVLRYLANGQRLATQVFGRTFGPLSAGSVADLIILDYRSPTPLLSENLAWHVIYGMASRLVDSVMVDGVWRMWGRKALAVNPDVLAAHAREAAQALWQRMEGT